MRIMNLCSLFLALVLSTGVQAFTTTSRHTLVTKQDRYFDRQTQLAAADLDVVALVAGQENYGLAVVAFGEGLYSFLQAPSMSNLKVFVPPLVAAGILIAVSGPMITSGDVASAGTGLAVATAVSLGLGASYVLRLLAPSYETLVPKEVAALGLLVAVAGFFSFSQNLLVDGFVQLPSIPFPLPEILPMPPSDNFVD